MPSIRANLALIAACDRNRVIGRDNSMPWHLPEDLRHFKALTMGAAVVMGRKTFESILASLGRPLPGRRNIVVSRSRRFGVDSVETHSTMESALEAASSVPRAFVIGGGELYAQALPLAATVHLTEIDASFDGDTYFPVLEPAKWIERARDEHVSAGEPPLRFAFVTYVRRADPQS